MMRMTETGVSMKNLPNGISTHVSYGELRRLADSLGVNVCSQLMSGGIMGCYDRENNAIIINRGMTYRRKRCALVHELVHWSNLDTMCGWLIDNRIEHRTRRKTAQLLVNLDEYKQAEIAYDGNIGLMASDLDVTKQVVEDYQHLVLSNIVRAV